MVDQSLNVVTWDNLRTQKANFSPINHGPSARRLGASLLLSFGISLPLECDPQSNPENGSDGKFLASPKLTRSGKPATVDPRQEIANNILLEHVAQHRVRNGTGRAFEPQSSDPAADGETLIAPGIYEKARARGSVRVIVELRLTAHREDSEASREDAIRGAQKALLDELVQANPRVIRNYTSIPALVLAASVDALKIIGASRHVIRVTEDDLSLPSKLL